MRIKRPRHFFAYPVSQPELSLPELLAGGRGVAFRTEWRGLTPFMPGEISLTFDDMALIDAIPPEEGVDRDTLAARFGPERVDRLIDAGLLLGDHPEHESLRRRDETITAAGWWKLAALVQGQGRWQGVDIAADEAREGRRTLEKMTQESGPLPPEVLETRPRETWQRLPAPRKTDLDDLLARRATCRNFDPGFFLPLEDLGASLHRVFGAQATQELAPGIVALKKNSPSGGGLHPIEAYVLVQRVQGLAPGLYHYQPVAHALEPMRLATTEELAAMAHELVAGQHWFANAPVQVLMAARFRRNYWKYRNHSKAWKVIQLDAGHLSQNLYLSATEQGYGAFVTGAINDECAERLFELDGVTVGAIAVCGFGRRAEGLLTTEFDPLGKSVRG